MMNLTTRASRGEIATNGEKRLNDKDLHAVGSSNAANPLRNSRRREHGAPFKARHALADN